jgi:hypothetical protein
MIKSVITVLTLALLVGVLALGIQQGATQTAMAQKTSKVADKVERAFKTKEPGWKLVGKVVGKTEDIHEWKFRNELVTYTIAELASPQAAAEALKHSTSLIATGDVNELKGIGDEAYYVAGDSKSTSAVHFRKNNVLVLINAPSVTLAKRFARHIEKEIDNY